MGIHGSILTFTPTCFVLLYLHSALEAVPATVGEQVGHRGYFPSDQMTRFIYLVLATSYCLLDSSVTLLVAQQQAVPVFILAGQSNMEGQGVVDLDHEKYYNGGKGTLNFVMKDPQKAWKFSHLKDKSGHWVERDDVFIRFRTKSELKRGKLSIGFTGYGGKHHIGPELQFGNVVGDALKERVLLIKTAWGGKSLFADFRPPSAEGETGPYYQKMMDEVDEAIDAIPDEFPELSKRKLEISGFVWMQGWNDMFNEDALAEYEQNLVHLVHDVRKHFDQPKLPVVIGELGNGGEKAGKNMLAIRAAQRSAASRKKFIGNVAFVPTAEFARPADQSPNVSHGHHWFGNAESYFLIGDALGRGMLELMNVGHYVVQDIPYKSGELTEYETERCKLDLYVPARAKDAPALVWFHGGGLTKNSKERTEASLVGRYFSNRGILVAVVNYRLSPRAKFPAYIEDAAASIDWMIDNIKAHGGDQRKVFVGGHSAGAYLTLLTCLDRSYLEKHGKSVDQLAGYIPVSSQVDSHWTVRAERGIGQDKKVIDKTAPLFHIPDGFNKATSPMLIIVAEDDLPGRADANQQFFRKLQKANHPAVAFQQVSKRNHVSLVTRIPQTEDETAHLILQFIKSEAKKSR